MLIIVEGADCTGKSTLINAIEKEISGEHVSILGKGPPTSKNPVVEYLWCIAGYEPGNGEHIICDRWHIGEMIYPDVFNRKSIMTSAQFEFIHNTLMHLGALVVYLEPPLSVVHKRFHERGDKLIKNIDELNESYFQFRTFMSRFKFNCDPRMLRLNHTEFDEELVYAVVQIAKMNEKANNYEGSPVI